MKRNIFWQISGLSFILVLSGCAVKTYTVVKDRVDQDLSAGNKGYITGTAPQDAQTSERKATRKTYVTEVELPLFGRPRLKPAPALQETESESAALASEETPTAQPERIEKYKVVSGDTLEKISQKFYGTTRKWTKIYEANKDKLSAPNKIYPGQIIDVPVENLKNK